MKTSTKHVSTKLVKEETGNEKTTGHTVRRRLRQETREEMLERLVNPQLTLHEASVILRVCPATVRNYCKAGFLPCERTAGRQRRFRLKAVLKLFNEREAERKARRRRS